MYCNNYIALRGHEERKRDSSLLYPSTICIHTYMYNYPPIKCRVHIVWLSLNHPHLSLQLTNGPRVSGITNAHPPPRYRELYYRLNMINS